MQQLPIFFTLASSILGAHGRIATPVNQRVLILDEDLNCNNSTRPDSKSLCFTKPNLLDGMAIVSTSDSSNVNTVTCTYQSARQDDSADCDTCLTGEQFGEGFELVNEYHIPTRGNGRTRIPCETTCVYEHVKNDDSRCVELCGKTNVGNSLPLSDCSFKDNDGEEILLCSYEGITKFFCNSCPGHIEGYEFWSKNAIEQDDFCKQTCRYTVD